MKIIEKIINYFKPSKTKETNVKEKQMPFKITSHQLTGQAEEILGRPIKEGDTFKIQSNKEEIEELKNKAFGASAGFALCTKCNKNTATRSECDFAIAPPVCDFCYNENRIK